MEITLLDVINQILNDLDSLQQVRLSYDYLKGRDCFDEKTRVEVVEDAFDNNTRITSMRIKYYSLKQTLENFCVK